jgi:uncharacterized protein (TIGR04222 family)
MSSPSITDHQARRSGPALHSSVTEFALIASGRPRVVLSLLAEMCHSGRTAWDQASGGFILKENAVAAASEAALHPQDFHLWNELHAALARGTGKVAHLVDVLSPVLDTYETGLEDRQLLWPKGERRPLNISLLHASTAGIGAMTIVAALAISRGDWSQALCFVALAAVQFIGRKMLIKSRRTPEGNAYFVAEMKPFQAWVEESEGARRQRLTEPMMTAWVMAAFGARMLAAFGKEKLGSTLALQHDETHVHRANDALTTPVSQGAG